MSRRSARRVPRLSHYAPWAQGEARFDRSCAVNDTPGPGTRKSPGDVTPPGSKIPSDLLCRVRRRATRAKPTAPPPCQFSEPCLATGLRSHRHWPLPLTLTLEEGLNEGIRDSAYACGRSASQSDGETRSSAKIDCGAVTLVAMISAWTSTSWSPVGSFVAGMRRTLTCSAVSRLRGFPRASLPPGLFRPGRGCARRRGSGHHLRSRGSSGWMRSSRWATTG